MKLEDLKDYKLVWSDEFDGDSLDATKWNLSKTDKEKKDAEGNTAVVFKDEDKLIQVKDGKLVLDTYYDENNKLYVSHKSVQTKEKMSFKYGYLEVRARIPFTSGTTAALWAYGKDAIGSDKNAPYYSRMHVFGHKGFFEWFSNNITKVYDNYDENHPFYEEGKSNEDDSKQAQNLGLNTPDSYHEQYVTEVMEEFKTYGFLWTPEAVIFTVNGHIVTRMKLTQDFLRPSGVEGFRKPQYLEFETNFFVNEHAKGNHITPERASEKIPFEIDYVRLYQKQGEGELNLAEQCLRREIL